MIGNGIDMNSIGHYPIDYTKWETDVYLQLPFNGIVRNNKSRIDNKRYETTLTFSSAKISSIGNGVRIESVPIHNGSSVYDLLPI